jgi:hypothetical protein
MQKYAFSIKTRSGQFIERIVIAGRDRDDAVRKLKQMYHYCEVVNCDQVRQANPPRRHKAALDDTLSLVTR